VRHIIAPNSIDSWIRSNGGACRVNHPCSYSKLLLLLGCKNASHFNLIRNIKVRNGAFAEAHARGNATPDVRQFI